MQTTRHIQKGMFMRNRVQVLFLLLLLLALTEPLAIAKDAQTGAKLLLNGEWRIQPSKDVREQGVFELSQLKEGEAEAALIALVRGSYPREVKQQALFWLGQSGSDEAIKFLDDMLAREPAKSNG